MPVRREVAAVATASPVAAAVLVTAVVGYKVLEIIQEERRESHRESQEGREKLKRQKKRVEEELKKSQENAKNEKQKNDEMAEELKKSQENAKNEKQKNDEMAEELADMKDAKQRQEEEEEKKTKQKREDERKIQQTIEELKRGFEEGCIAKRFKKMSFLGSGGFGAVHVWKDIKSGASLAVKEVPISNTENTESLKTESESLSKLEHDNVLKSFGAIYDPSSEMVFLCMELMETSIGKLVKVEALPESITLSYTRDMMDGVIYIHSRGIIHCDIKGDNVLIDGSGRAKLADFGISKYVANTSSKSSKHFFGTLPYVSPELFDDEKKLTEKSDMWAIGCTVCEMLTQHPPFWNEGAMQIMKKTVGLQQKNTVNEMECSDEVKDFLRVIFVEFDERPVPADIRQNRWLELR